MTTRAEFVQVLQQVLNEREPRRIIHTGFLGTRVTGAKVVEVPERPGFVYVRLRGDASSVAIAFNERVPPFYDTPVRLMVDEFDPKVYRILGRNIGVYPTWPASASIGSHGAQHQFGGGDQAGRDIVWVHKGQFTAMLARPIGDEGTMQLYVEEDWYEWGSGVYYFAGAYSPDLASYRPTGAYSQKYVTLYFDGADETVKVLEGTEYQVYPYPPTDPHNYVPTISSLLGINLCSVSLGTGTSSIWWDRIWDIRPVIRGGPR